MEEGLDEEEAAQYVLDGVTHEEREVLNYVSEGKIMKITEKQLKQIIKEEASKLVEARPRMTGSRNPQTGFGVKKSDRMLMKLADDIAARYEEELAKVSFDLVVEEIVKEWIEQNEYKPGTIKQLGIDRSTEIQKLVETVKRLWQNDHMDLMNLEELTYDVVEAFAKTGRMGG